MKFAYYYDKREEYGTEVNNFKKVTSGSCFDLPALWGGFLKPFERVKVETGIYMKFPDSCVGLVCPRSGLAYKHGITILNSPGNIDSDYRGDVSVILHNTSNEIFYWNTDDRIAQLLILDRPMLNVSKNYEKVFEEETERGDKGFGSSGVK